MADKKNRTVHAELSPAVASSSASLTIRVDRVLLKDARRLLDAGEWAASILLAQTASEVFIERTLAQMFQAHRMDRFWAEVGEFIPNYNLWPGNQRLRRLYVALSDDFEIANQSFWTDGSLTAHVKRRNKIAHEGVDATREEAEASFAAIDALMNHVQGVRARLSAAVGA